MFIDLFISHGNTPVDKQIGRKMRTCQLIFLLEGKDHGGEWMDYFKRYSQMEKGKKNASILFNMLRLLIYCSVVMPEMERGNSKWSLVKCCHILFSFRRDNLSIA
jgi:hypothetical protein